MAARVLSLTPELVARCHRVVPDEGRHPRLTSFPDEAYAPLAARLLKDSLPGPLWIFAYGSLVWNPTFHAVETRRATAVGWHRSFCIEMQNWRGSRVQPGLMMALDTGGRCSGLVYRIADEGRETAINDLVDREIGYHEDVASIRWLNVATAAGAVRALVFYAAPRGIGVQRRLPLERVAWILARACGHVGSGADYLYQTVLRLEQHGIHDRNLWRLQALVAAEIAALHGMGPG
ncbi:gamma-glutamylcyclotransferase [Rhizobium sp. TRM95111]|uniref:gamma-glutamylcyclotransferase n=1 Tax=Rhizobium alarense TaxID=2846851 RepID=UPI001F2E61B3|nr:gamma-glutamylcyclotransferase [Rhizobium alarense]MCF3642354.1 gamma-glutamylcyclotransferase [Rhizobium alarense]